MKKIKNTEAKFTASPTTQATSTPFQTQKGDMCGFLRVCWC